jgi:hypothetical protein
LTSKETSRTAEKVSLALIKATPTIFYQFLVVTLPKIRRLWLKIG